MGKDQIWFPLKCTEQRGSEILSIQTTIKGLVSNVCVMLFSDMVVSLLHTESF